MAGATSACRSLFNTASCMLHQADASRAGRKSDHLCASQGKELMRKCTSGATRSIEPRKQFLRGCRLTIKATKGTEHVSMSAEPEIKETKTTEEGEDPEISAYEKELKVGKFKITGQFWHCYW
jgi:hypothetical protein